MRQRRWLELLKDYDFSIEYHPGKANVVADALSRCQLAPRARPEYELLEAAWAMCVTGETSVDYGICAQLHPQSIPMEVIVSGQQADSSYARYRSLADSSENKDWVVAAD